MTDNLASSSPLPPARAIGRAGQLRLVVLAAAVLVAVLLLIAGARALFTSPPPVPPKLPAGAFRPTPEQLAQLTIAPVTSGADAQLVRASGAIAVDGDHSTPVLLPFSGQVLAVYVEPGRRVAKGQPLLRIASPEMVDARNALATAAAQRASAAEALRVATASAARQKAIYETAGGALKDYTQSQADLVAAQSALRTAESAERAARNHVAIFGSSGDSGGPAGQPATVYRAPVAGLIADRNVAPGQFVTAGGTTPLLTITDPSRVWLVAQLAESDAATVHVGDQVRVTTPALPGRTFAARIDNVGAALDPNSHRLPVRASIDNPDGALKPQMFASFTISRRTGGGDAVLVPGSAVIHEGDSARVWVEGRDRLLYARPVTTGPSEGGFTRILAGLKPGDRVVTKGALFVNEAGLDQ
ncbi:efflux RND transporter periplasmic adaptor subunit [Sphingomonas sp. CL5.1]|uniref:efflux RND transporter periplasmic adaptor subunit n=1 Tax=Sphingomonas sp. CL5.1 TaxID=2653203 RepID=UPI0015819C97|nr:efflux RND transporter periplasmic adaptor subunit [Sphingomonas sp. CL5.1]